VSMARTPMARKVPKAVMTVLTKNNHTKSGNALGFHR